MKNKVCVITGASSGIGKALAFEAAKRGAHLVLAARRQEELEQVKKNIEITGSRVIAVVADVTQESDCKKIIEGAIEEYGKIDILINNAGISMRALFAEVEISVLKKVMDVNFWGAVYCTKYALPYLLESKGCVVGISSIAGYKGLPGRTGYSASKFALQGFLEVLRIETMKKGLHVLIACPGFTTSEIRKTALNAKGESQGESPRDENKMMSAEETAEKICNAIEKRKKILVLTTQGKMTVLLNKFFPFFMDKMVYNHMAKEPGSGLNI